MPDELNQEQNQEQHNQGGQEDQSLLGGHGQQDGEQGNGEKNQNQDAQPTGAPESIDDYDVNVDGFDYAEFKAIPENLEFLERARSAGMNNEALSFMMGEYSQLIPQLMQANAALDNEAATEHMTDIWGADTSANFGHANAAAQNAIQNGILTAEEVNSPAFGNNPIVLKAMAYFGAQLSEDTPAKNTQNIGIESRQELMKSEAYMDSNHPDHKAVHARVAASYQKEFN